METVRALVAELLRMPVDAVTDDLAMETTEAWDSLAHMDLVAMVEERFAIVLTMDEIVAMTSVQAIRQVLISRGLAA